MTISVIAILSWIFLDVVWSANAQHRRYTTPTDKIVPNKTWVNTIKAGSKENTENITIDNSADLFEGPFSKWPHAHPLPCYPVKRGDKFNLSHVSTGFVYIRPANAASTLSAGINTRIARNVAIRQGYEGGLCRHNWHHSRAVHHNFTERKENLFLWTMLRDPFRRAVDEFFQKVDQKGMTQSYHCFKEFMLSQDMKKYYIHQLSTKHFASSSDDINEAIRQIFCEYNFIGVAERLDESLVVLSLLLGLKLGDILYLTSNLGNDYDSSAYDGRCPKTPSFVTPEMEMFSRNEEWQSLAEFDNLLIQQVHRKLDQTIDHLGRDKVKQVLVKFRAARSEATRRCIQRTIFPCNANGTKNKGGEIECVHGSVACGMNCLDEVAIDYNVPTRH